MGIVVLEPTGDTLAYALLTRRRGKGSPAYSGTDTNPLLTVMVDVLTEFVAQPSERLRPKR